MWLCHNYLLESKVIFEFIKVFDSFSLLVLHHFCSSWSTSTSSTETISTIIFHLFILTSWANKTILIPPFFFIEVPVPSLESERSCICMLGISILPHSKILIFDFGIVCFSISLNNCVSKLLQNHASYIIATYAYFTHIRNVWPYNVNKMGGLGPKTRLTLFIEWFDLIYCV